MLKQLQRTELDRLLETIANSYRLQTPQLLTDGTRQLGAYDPDKVSLAGEQLQRKPTNYFFPQTELMLSIDAAGAVRQPAKQNKPLALFGLDRNDLAAIAFLDRFFMAAPADDLYLRRREGALLIGLTGLAGVNNDFLPLARENCDFELIATRNSWLAAAYSETGRNLLLNFTAAPEQLPERQHLAEKSLAGQEKLQLASRLLLGNKVPDKFWQELADRCILCSGCNLACPTCSCFCLQDRQTATETERSRVWDSCQLDAFMREASGHNPLGTEALRTRRRIHHKLAADVERWGEIGCVACGRCDRACPTGIGMLAVVEEIVSRFGNTL